MPFTFDKLIHSTMTRAIEMASIILKHLPNDLPVEVTDCLCEGAPYPPEPPIGHWKPDRYVSHFRTCRNLEILVYISYL